MPATGASVPMCQTRVKEQATTSVGLGAMKHIAVVGLTSRRSRKRAMGMAAVTVMEEVTVTEEVDMGTEEVDMGTEVVDMVMGEEVDMVMGEVEAMDMEEVDTVMEEVDMGTEEVDTVMAEVDTVTEGVDTVMGVMDMVKRKNSTSLSTRITWDFVMVVSLQLCM